MKSITAIGVMSGTSVDGLDMAAVNFEEKNGKWNFRIVKSETTEYPPVLKKKLIDCIKYSGEDLTKLDFEFGNFIGKAVNIFLKEEKFRPDFISSHGHTVFHQPENRLTLQIGDGQTIMNKTGLTVINDFRKLDVLRGGHGAPLVPIGDKYLFREYDFCLNIGGFSNVSFENDKNERIAYDISPANIVLNFLARKAGKDYDKNGAIASKGKIIEDLLRQLNDLEYYSKAGPKSLGLEWVKNYIYPLLEKHTHPDNLQDILRTCSEHISIQIGKSIEREINTYGKNPDSVVLVTGGGAYNEFLIEGMKTTSSGIRFIIPEKEIIDFKEALIFAFLGALRIEGKINVLRSVTGACQDSSAGTIYRP